MNRITKHIPSDNFSIDSRQWSEDVAAAYHAGAKDMHKKKQAETWEAFHDGWAAGATAACFGCCVVLALVAVMRWIYG